MSSTTKRWAIFTTNYGRSAIKMLELMEQHELPNTEIGFVLYENLPSGAAEKAEQLGIKTIRLIKSDYADRQAYEKAILEKLRENAIDFIFLLGFSYLLKHEVLEQYTGKIANIHPSILPSFKGKRAIQQAMDYGVRYSGMTTHYIDDKMDEGTIIAQLPIPIHKGDTFEAVDERYMAASPQIIKETILEVNDQ